MNAYKHVNVLKEDGTIVTVNEKIMKDGTRTSCTVESFSPGQLDQLIEMGVL